MGKRSMAGRSNWMIAMNICIWWSEQTIYIGPSSLKMNIQTKEMCRKLAALVRNLCATFSHFISNETLCFSWTWQRYNNLEKWFYNICAYNFCGHRACYKQRGEVSSKSTKFTTFLTEPIAIFRRNFSNSFQKICFKKSDENDEEYHFTWVLLNFFSKTKWIESIPFFCRINANNSTVVFNGTTHYDTEQPLLHHVHVDDEEQRHTYQIIFTDEELNSTDTFCKHVAMKKPRKLAHCYEITFNNLKYYFPKFSNSSSELHQLQSLEIFGWLTTRVMFYAEHKSTKNDHFCMTWFIFEFDQLLAMTGSFWEAR